MQLEEMRVSATYLQEFQDLITLFDIFLKLQKKYTSKLLSASVSLQKDILKSDNK